MLASFVSHFKNTNKGSSKARKVTSVTHPRNLLPRLFTSIFLREKPWDEVAIRNRVQMT